MEWNGTRSLRLLAGLSIVVALAGCTVPMATTTSAPPSPTPSTPADPTLVEPAPRIPGGCSDFISQEHLAALGDPAAEERFVTLTGTDLAVARQSGDLRCQWESGGIPYWLSLTVQRDARLRADDTVGEGFTEELDSGTPAGVGADDSGMTCDLSSNPSLRCHLAAIVDDYVVSISWNAPRTDLSQESARALVASVVTPLVDRLRSEPVEPSWTPPTGAWPDVVDCAAIDGDGAVAAALASPGLIPHDTTGEGEDSAVSPEVGRLGGLTQCGWSGVGGETPAGEVPSLYVQAVSGGGWAWSTLPPLEGFEVVSVDGADEAGTVCIDYPDQLPECEFTARLGENLVSVREYSCCGPNDITRDQLIAGATAVVSGLSRTY